MVDNWEGLSLFSNDDLRELVFEGIQLSPLLRQIVQVKIVFKTCSRDMQMLKAVIDRALLYKRPTKDTNWGHYDDYLHEIKKSVLALKDEISASELKSVLMHLKEQAEKDEVMGEFDEDGEWGMAIEDIGEHILLLEEK